MAESFGGPEALPRPTPGAPPPPRVPQPHRWLLDNGLRVIAIPRGGAPQVEVRIAVPAGAWIDPPGREGAAALLAAALPEGTARLSPEDLNARWDFLGAELSTHAGHDHARIGVTLLSETLPEVLSLLGDTVMDPALAEREVERLRTETLDALAARDDEPANVADDRAAREVFGEQHPYGRPSVGTLTGVRRVRRDDLLAVHVRHIRPRGSFLVAAGDFEISRFRELVGDVFGRWHGEAPLPRYPSRPSAPPAAGERIYVVRENAAQAELRIAGLGLERSAADWIPAAVANYLLGGSTTTGRLGANLREEKGWTYGVHSAFSAAIDRGSWIAETAVRREVANAALDEMLYEVRRLGAEPAKEEELQRAKDALVLSLPQAFATPASIADRFASLERFGLPADYWITLPARVEAVTAADVQRIARDHLAPARLVQVVVGGDT